MSVDEIATLAEEPRSLTGILQQLTEAAASSAVTEESDFTGPQDITRPDPLVAPYRLLLETLPLDQPSFQVRFQRSRAELLADLRAAYAAARTDPDADAVGFAGVVLLTLILVDDFDHRRAADDAHAAPDAPEESEPVQRTRAQVLAECQAIVAEPRVHTAIQRIYAPVPGDAASRQAALVWSQLDFAGASLYKIGSTSLILRVRAQALGGNADPQELVAKCVLLPFTRIPAIAKSTAEYADTFQLAGGGPRFVPTIWASTRTWIVMTYIEGRTLAEELGSRSEVDSGFGQVTPGLRLDLLARYVPSIFDALGELQRQGTPEHPWVHADLSPSNIIVTRTSQGISGVVFVDLGRNFLYSRAIAGLGGAEGAYVAPEVRDDEVDDSRADLYSLGKLIIRIAGGDPEERYVPNAFYERVPALARFVEDLVDRTPAQRLLVYGANGRGWNYEDLKAEFTREVDAVRQAEAAQAVPFDGKWLAGVIDLLRPGSRSPSRQWRLYRERINQGAAAVSAPDSRRRTDRRYAGWLALWSMVCAIVFYLVLLVLGKQVLRDLGQDPTPDLLQAAVRAADLAGQRWLGSFVDSLRGFFVTLVGEPGVVNASARISGVFFTLVGVRYYQNIFAGLMPLLGQSWMSPARRLRAWITELLMRVFAWIWALMVLIGNLGHPRWWPILCAIGIFASFLLNWAVSSFANSAIAQARAAGVRTVPASAREITGLRMFEQWTPSQGVFAIITAVAGYLIFTGRLHDELMYAIMLSVANVGIFYTVKTSLNAAEIRAGLARAFLASERTQLLRRIRMAR